MVKKLKYADCKGLNSHTRPLATRLERGKKCIECVHMIIYGPHHIAILARQRYMICFMDEYSVFKTISFVEKFIEVRKTIEEYIAKTKMQRNDQVKLLKVQIEEDYMKNIHELISLSLEIESILFVFSSISPTSRVGATEKYCTRLINVLRDITSS